MWSFYYMVTYMNKFNEIKETKIIPMLDNLYSKECTMDSEILDALNDIENAWKELEIPNDYAEALKKLECPKYSYNEILNVMPYTYLLIFTLRLIADYTVNNKDLESELSLVSSLIQINSDLSKDIEDKEFIERQILLVHYIMLSKTDDEKNNLINNMETNTKIFKEKNS